jgi:UDP-N-acetylmuramyl pentapeptide synthase
VWAVGRFAAETVRGARAAGNEAREFADKPALATALAPELGPGLAVLFKGSRGAALEDVLAALEPRVGEA